MRNIPVNLQSHITQEVLSLTRCIQITKTNGAMLRLTTHDVDITVQGDVYRTGVPIDISAIESTDTLSVDNAEMAIALDEVTILKSEFNEGLYDNAKFQLFNVNWETPEDGVIYLKKGTIGDIEIVNEEYAKLQLRGLTAALNTTIVERYSPTCRTSLGSARCGYANLPTQVRRDNQRVRTWDWYTVPNANITTPALTNMGFESGTSMEDWIVPGGSVFTAESSIAAYSGTKYAQTGAGVLGDEFTFYRDLTTSTIGMVDGNIDSGDYSADFTIQITTDSSTIANDCIAFIEQYDVNGYTLKREESKIVEPTLLTWQGIGVTSIVVPNCRFIRVGVISYLSDGTAGSIAYDGAAFRFFTNVMSTFNSKVFRTTRIPDFEADKSNSLTYANSSFESDGAVANTNTSADITGWDFNTSQYWQVQTTQGGLAAYAGTYSLYGGDNSSTTPNSVYTMSQDIVLVDDPCGCGAAPEDITAGWYYAEVRAKVAKTDSDSEPQITISFLNVSDSVIGSFTDGYATGLTEDVWSDYNIGGAVPSGTVKIRVTLSAKSGAGGSAANVGFDSVSAIFTATAHEGEGDAEIGYLANTSPSYSYSTGAYTNDGNAIVQAQDVRFGFSDVTAVTDQRLFEATGISQAAEEMYSGKITWLSGDNAGRTSFIRVWDDTSKEASLYDSLTKTIQVGDKFIYSLGCDKTIGACADLFGNAHNFRGEPYLPGPAKVIEFLTTTTNA